MLVVVITAFCVPGAVLAALLRVGGDGGKAFDDLQKVNRGCLSLEERGGGGCGAEDVSAGRGGDGRAQVGSQNWALGWGSYSYRRISFPQVPCALGQRRQE